MSVGKTTNLELLYAQPDDPVPNYPQLNAFNMDLLDPLFGSTEQQSYQPSLEFSSGSPNPGDAADFRGAYLKIFDLYFFWIWLQLGGSGVDMGTGTLRFTLPASVDSSYSQGNTGFALGGGFVNPGGGLDRQFVVPKLSSSGNRNVIFVVCHANSANWVLQGDSPAVFAAGDQIELFGRFKGAT